MDFSPQATRRQIEQCAFHNRPVDEDLTRVPEPTCLAFDHVCGREDFPSEQIQCMTDHCEEVTFCKFSPDGLRLATCAKDMTVIIWDFNPKDNSFKKFRDLERSLHGVSTFAWSPDSTRLAVCGTDDFDEV